MAARIVVMGSVNTDLVIRGPRIPSPGETVTGGSFLQTQGGKGANQAVAAARAGADVTFLARVGDDELGETRSPAWSGSPSTSVMSRVTRITPPASLSSWSTRWGRTPSP